MVETLWNGLLASLLVLLIVFVWVVIGAVILGLVQYARGKRPAVVPSPGKGQRPDGGPSGPRIVRKEGDK